MNKYNDGLEKAAQMTEGLSKTLIEELNDLSFWDKLFNYDADRMVVLANFLNNLAKAIRKEKKKKIK